MSTSQSTVSADKLDQNVNLGTFKAIAAKKKGGKFEIVELERKPLYHDEVRVRVYCCGLCHTDIHNLYNDWMKTVYPYVPGHEWVGVVIEVGSSVPPEHARVGDRVGGGFLCRTCGKCDMCESGSDNHCKEMVEMMLQGHTGGMAEEVVCQSAHVFKIPDNVASEDAGPLMCAGLTVWNALISYGAKPFERVAVMGLGGLGSVAVKFAKHFGCYTYVVSHTDDKREDAIALGADEFINCNDPAEMEKIMHTIDVMLIITHDARDWGSYATKYMKVNGRMVVVGFVEKNMEFNALPLILKRVIIGGSNVGSRDDMKKMIRFASERNITVEKEVFGMSDINEAVERLMKNQMRYRGVLMADFDQVSSTSQ